MLKNSLSLFALFTMILFASCEKDLAKLYNGNLSPAYSNEPGSGFSFSGRFEGTEKVSLTIDFNVASLGIQNINIAEGNRVVK